MPDFDIDEILSSFEGKSKSAPKSDFDIDAILSDFNTKSTIPETTKRVVINTDPKPPISGISKEASDELNQTRQEKFGGENPRNKLPTTSIQESAYDADLAGKEMISSGIGDMQSGHPYKGVGQTALGAVMRAGSPMTGIIEGGVSRPIADITGSKEIGDKAGFVASTAVPVVPGAGAIIKALPKNRALSTLVENIGQENLPSVVAGMKANSRLAPADLSPRVLQDAQHLFANDGLQIDYLAKASGDRMATRRSAIEEAYDTSAGNYTNIAQKINDLAEASKKVGSEQINPAIANAGTVNITPAITHINSVINPGVMSKISEGSTLALPEVKQALAAAKNLLTNGKETRTGASDLHDIQKSLRRQGYDKTKSPDAGERETGRALLELRNKIVDAIDAASPQVNGKGTYKPALESYRDEMHIADAFREGHDKIFSSSKKIENDPSFIKKWFDGLTDNEKQAAKEGARTAVYTEMGMAKNPALAGESFMRSDFNKAKMEILFGREETDKLLKALADERTIANTHNKIVEGSQTAMRTASKSQFALPTKTEVMKSTPAVAAAEVSNYFMGGLPGVGTGILGVAKAGAMAKDAIRMKLAREHNAQYAKYALPTEGPSRDALISALEAHIPGPKQSLVTRGANTLTRLVAP